MVCPHWVMTIENRRGADDKSGKMFVKLDDGGIQDINEKEGRRDGRRSWNKT